MKYKDYHISDFLKDGYFMDWVRGSDPDVHEFWQKWMRLHPEKADTVKRAKQIALSIGLQDRQPELSEKESLNLYERIVRREKVKALPEQIEQKKQIWPFFKMVAAVVLLVLPALYVWQTRSIATEKSTVSEAPIEFTWLTSQNPQGQKSSIKLPDGSLVRLNANSTLRFPEHFSGNQRLVLLEGEAFFDVAEDKNRPFIIRSGGIETKVLGTSFNINTGDAKQPWVLAVVTGKVAVQNQERDRLELTPLEAAVYSQKTGSLQKKPITDLKSYISWKEGVLYFQDASFPSVSKILENWYGVTVEMRGSPLKGRYSGEYKNETLKNVLTGFCYTSGCTFDIKGKKVIIYNAK